MTQSNAAQRGAATSRGITGLKRTRKRVARIFLESILRDSSDRPVFRVCLDQEPTYEPLWYVDRDGTDIIFSFGQLRGTLSPIRCEELEHRRAALNARAERAAATPAKTKAKATTSRRDKPTKRTKQT